MSDSVRGFRAFAREITWPSMRTVRSNLASVLLMSGLMAVLVGVADFAVTGLVSMVLSMT